MLLSFDSSISYQSAIQTRSSTFAGCKIVYQALTIKAAGDLSFSAGDRIEIIERTESSEDWWTGKVNGKQGIFPGNYTQTD
jgi:hypothetical protein